MIMVKFKIIGLIKQLYYLDLNYIIIQKYDGDSELNNIIIISVLII